MLALVVALLSVPAFAADPGIERTVLAEVPYVAVTTCVNELLHLGGVTFDQLQKGATPS